MLILRVIAWTRPIADALFMRSHLQFALRDKRCSQVSILSRRLREGSDEKENQASQGTVAMVER